MASTSASDRLATGGQEMSLGRSDGRPTGERERVIGGERVMAGEGWEPEGEGRKSER